MILAAVTLAAVTLAAVTLTAVTLTAVTLDSHKLSLTFTSMEKGFGPLTIRST